MAEGAARVGSGERGQMPRQLHEGRHEFRGVDPRPLRGTDRATLERADERQHEGEREGEQQDEDAYRPQGNW
jgi:hypothetical protein